MSELFIELLSEEIPYWLQKNIVEQFKEKITDVIIENNLSLKNKVSIDSNFTQLRLIFSCSNLIKEQKTSIKAFFDTIHKDIEYLDNKYQSFHIYNIYIFLLKKCDT